MASLWALRLGTLWDRLWLELHWGDRSQLLALQWRGWQMERKWGIP